MRATTTKQQKGARATRGRADAHVRTHLRQIRKAWVDSAGNLARAAAILNAQKVPTLRGGRWYAASLSRAIHRLEKLRGRPLAPDELLDTVSDQLRQQETGHRSAPRYSVDGRRLRSQARLDADREVRHRQALRDRREFRKQHGARLKARLVELYKKHRDGNYSARTIAADLNAEGFPAPPHSKGGKWSATGILREGKRVGAPWPRKYTAAQWRAHLSDKELEQAWAEAEQLERRGNLHGVERVLARYSRNAAKHG